MILLTGASGFIGEHLLLALVDKYGVDNVLALTSKPIKGYKCLLHNNYQFEPNYFIENGYANSINIVIHGGAYIPKYASQANNRIKCNENIYNTGKLLDSVLPNLQKIICLSTIDVYGAAHRILETVITQPSSLYGYSKLYCEKLVEEWANENGKTAQILRLGHVYGPGEQAYQKIIPTTIRKIIKNEPVQIWGDGKELRAFIYIKDITTAILNALNLHQNVGPINLVSNNSISIIQLVNKLFDISGKAVNINMVSVNSIARSLSFDNSKMREYLLKEETDLNKGLIEEWHYMNQINE